MKTPKIKYISPKVEESKIQSLLFTVGNFFPENFGQSEHLAMLCDIYTCGDEICDACPP